MNELSDTCLRPEPIISRLPIDCKCGVAVLGTTFTYPEVTNFIVFCKKCGHLELVVIDE